MGRGLASDHRQDLRLPASHEVCGCLHSEATKGSTALAPIWVPKRTTNGSGLGTLDSRKAVYSCV